VGHGSTLRSLTFVTQVELDALTHIKLNGVMAPGIAGLTIGDRLLMPVKVNASDR